jgi:MFS family permease
MTTTTAIANIELQKVSTKDSGHTSLHRLPREQPPGGGNNLPSGSSSAEQVTAETTGTTPAPKDPKQVTRARTQFSALCWCLFLAGWNDGSIGPLLPRIREVYHVGFTLVSLIFVIACVGFCIGALINVFATGRINFGKIIVIGCTLQTIAYAIQSAAPPFPLFVIAFAINGAGLAVQDAQANGYVAAWNDNNKMGVLHAAYGLGAFCAPLVSTQFSQLEKWSFHFLVSLGIALSNIIVLAIVFRFKDQDESLQQIGIEPGEKNTNEQSNMRQLVSLKAVHLLAAFIFIYVGVEVTIGGTFLSLSTCSVLAALTNIHPRLDCHLYHRGTRRRSFSGIHLFRLLRWSHCRTCDLTLGQQEDRRTQSSLPLLRSRNCI